MQETFTQILSDHSVVAPLVFIAIRALAIIIPPIPGVLVDIPGILAFGWFLGFIYAEIGIMLGAMVAFWIARRFREPFIGKFVSLQRLSNWEKKLSDTQRFWGLVAIRMPTNPLFDLISYAAGLTGISPLKFFFSTLIGNVPSVFLFFYFGGLSFNKGIYYSVAFIVALFILWLAFQKALWKNIDQG